MRFALALALASCATSPPDVTGPIGGTPQRFVVDGFTLPQSQEAAHAVGDDGTRANQLGLIIAALAGEHDLTAHAADMIAAGRIASFGFVRADGDRGGVWLMGEDGDDATPCLGTFDNGAFRANRPATTKAPGRARIVLPVIADADPVTLDVERLAIDLAPDGSGGFDATLHGVVAREQALLAAADGLVQMLAASPREHPDLFLLLDVDHDHVVTVEEVEANALIKSQFTPDQTLGAMPALSVGIGMHLAACERGTCAPEVTSCFDRIQDDGEADVDCGGACARKCPVGSTCTSAADCDANACDNGRCRAASCTDGIADGAEGDLDCGGFCDTKCATGAQCFASRDCAGDRCSACHPDSIGVEVCTGAGTCEP